MACDLCKSEAAPSDLDRVSGVDLCGYCRSSDPTEALLALGIAVSWSTWIGWFSAEAGSAFADPELYLSCSPELLHHKLVKLVVNEVEVGDPAFDSNIYVRTSDPMRAGAILASEGVQSALLGLLSGVLVNEMQSNHVTLADGRLRLRVRPRGGLSEERQHELKLETAALLLHLQRA